MYRNAGHIGRLLFQTVVLVLGFTLNFPGRSNCYDKLAFAQTVRNKARKLTSEQIDALWDYNDPAASCQKFQDAVASAPGSSDEIRTQIARCLGLQRKFDEGRAEIAKVSPNPSPIVACRVALESGRIENSSGYKSAAKPYFLQAFNLARKHNFDFYAVDAAHMMGIVTSDAESQEWNEKAIKMAEESKDKRARNWKGSLLNNTGWTYHDMGQYDKALKLFQKALDFQKERGNESGTRIANWTVGRCLRSLKRYDEALAIQRSLEGGPSAGYIEEEMGELLLVTGHPDQSKPYFKKAYEKLSTDIWLRANEAPRLERMKKLSE
jgi:tetratricopeptide (TPR) repeat protein